MGTPLRPHLEQSSVRNFGKLKVRGFKTKQAQAVLSKDLTQRDFSRMSHEDIMRLIQRGDAAQARALSRFFFKTNGMYCRALRYISDLNKYDFIIYPNIKLQAKLQEEDTEKILEQLDVVLDYFDAANVQSLCRKWSTQICLEGAYYGYVCDDVPDQFVIQDLPVDYCRSLYSYRGRPVIEFNVRYFRDITTDENYRKRILSLFDKEIQNGWRSFLNGRLPAEIQGDEAGWMVLDVNKAFKFNFYGLDLLEDKPPFLSAIIPLIELNEVQDLEKEKLLQQIQKILVQEFALDKNGQLPFTVDELQQLNQNAIDMVGDAVGISCLSTTAGVHLEDLSNTNGVQSDNFINAAESTVYNNWGISANLFNTTGNTALEKSVTTDGAFVKQLILQFENFFNSILAIKFDTKDLIFKMKILPTTIFNEKELSNAYKDLTKIGFSRFLPIVALGHSQKEVISMVKLEQQILEIDAYMVPPFSSNTMSSDTWLQAKEHQEQIMSGNSPLNDSEDGSGRPELPDDQKSDKTLANLDAIG